MNNSEKFYIDGKWVLSNSDRKLDVKNPANGKVIDKITLGNKKDLDLAVKAAKNAFKSFSLITKKQKIDIFNNIIDVYKKKLNELSSIITSEMGAPKTLAEKAQAPSGLGHFIQVRKIIEDFSFEKKVNSSYVRKEPVGVCGLITPWNWPLNQIACKVAPALAAGCTMILKPSEEAPLNAIIFAEILHEAGLPKGVFNLVNGMGEEIGSSMSKHPDIDMISFTGSTNAGISVAKNSADTVKRVTQELGGKSANIILDDDLFSKAIVKGVYQCMNNSGQSCNAPTRMLIPSKKMDDAIRIARETAEKLSVGDPNKDSTNIGPVINERQYTKIQDYIRKGIEEGADLIVGGVDLPQNLNKGFFIKPTIFANVTENMTIAKEEIFGPVLSILGFNTEQEAIEIANNTIYGLSGYVSAQNKDKAKEIANKLRTGMVHINYAPVDQNLPFGGYKMSGNGREWGAFGIEDFLENKAVIDSP